jgi:hypothetical protein
VKSGFASGWHTHEACIGPLIRRLRGMARQACSPAVGTLGWHGGRAI